MINKIEFKIIKHPHAKRTFEILMVLFIMLYPLRHIHIGLDLADTGYNYTNYEYMGLEHMDSMWFFSTFFSNLVGHFLTLLPYGKTLLGINFYTGLIVSFVSLAAYLFCTRELKFNKFLTFLGEYVAICLCWCPTAKFYDYMTYAFMTMAVICLYYGLYKHKNICLFIAGIILGLNVFVRFSNLPEVIFIFAVWAFGIIEANEKIKQDKNMSAKRIGRIYFRKTLGRTIICIAGYLLPVLGMLGYFGIRYGFSAYSDAIIRLFGMTESNTSYSGRAMITGTLRWYVQGSYWLSRSAFFVVLGIIFCAIGKILDNQLNIGYESVGRGKRRFIFTKIGYGLSIIFAIAACVWLYVREFWLIYRGEYSQMLMPATVLILISILICIYTIFNPKIDSQDKLIAGLVLIIILITPIGSNTEIYTIINNLFLVFPFFLNNLWKMLKIKEWEGIDRYNKHNPLYENGKKKNIFRVLFSYVSLFPMKAMAVVFFIVCLVEFSDFGYRFVFDASQSAKDTWYTVSDNQVLSGIRMNYTKARDIGSLSEYIESEELSGEELITYGGIPGLSFYLKMPPAFNAWIDLPSYTDEVLKENLDLILENASQEMLSDAASKSLNVIKDNNKNNTEDEIEQENKNYYPIVILKADYKDLLTIEDIDAVISSKEASEEDKVFAEMALTDSKWNLLLEFFDEAGYKVYFTNEAYIVLRVVE